jgi:hypothetical protein
MVKLKQMEKNFFWRKYCGDFVVELLNGFINPTSFTTVLITRESSENFSPAISPFGVRRRWCQNTVHVRLGLRHVKLKLEIGSTCSQSITIFLKISMTMRSVSVR